jgi:hypothetical protein
MGYSHQRKGVCPQEPGCDFTWRCKTCPNSRTEMAMPYVTVFAIVLAILGAFVWLLTP